MKLRPARRNPRKRTAFLPFSFKLLSFAILITLLITIIMLVAFKTEVISGLELPPAATIPNLHVLTPLHLFFLLNLLIISIILTTHLHKQAPPAARVPASATSHHTFSAAPVIHEVQASRRFDNAENEAHYRAEVVTLCGHADTCLSETIAGNDSWASDRQKKSKKLPLNLARSDHNIELDLIGSDHEECLLNQAESDHQQQESKHSMIGKNAPDTSSDGPQVAAADYVEEAKQKSSGKSFYVPGQERPLASTHFMHKKVINRVHACNIPLKIARPSARKGDTLDATWKAICDDKANYSSPLRHHIASRTRKGDYHANLDKVDVRCSNKESLTSCMSPSKQKHRVATSSSTNGLIRRREPSIPRDELNARVESFISKFNQQIRIQRQESLLNHRKMVSRGAN